MKISIVTAVYNNRCDMESCLRSISSQSHADINHIIIDGGSTDGTVEVINEFMSKESEDTSHFTLYSSRVISEPDNGLYDAMNKGIRMAEGDIIGILNSDDVFADENVVSRDIKNSACTPAVSAFARILRPLPEYLTFLRNREEPPGRESAAATCRQSVDSGPGMMKCTPDRENVLIYE